MAPLIVPAIDPFERPALLGVVPYVTSVGASVGSCAGQNCRVSFVESAVLDSADRRILHYVDTEWDFVHDRTVVESIRSRPAPRLVYWGDRFARTPAPGAFWAALEAGDVVACPVFRDPGESDAALMDAGQWSIDAAVAQGFTCAIVAGLWNRNHTIPNQAVLDAGLVYRWWLEDAGCAGLLFFGLNFGRDTYGAAPGPPQFVAEFQTLADSFRVGGVPAFAPIGSALRTDG